MDSWDRIEKIFEPLADEFAAALKNSRLSQERLLLEILKTNEDCEIGRKYGFSSIDSPAEFSRRVPIRTYEELEEDIIRTIHGTPVICAEPLIFVEETGGSAGGKKLIPFTEKKLFSFQRALHPWFFDLFQSFPSIKKGRMYWTISPACRSASAPLPLPVGISNDAHYFGREAATALSEVLIGANEGLDRLLDPDEWRFKTLKELLAADDLSLISIWSPTYLLKLLRFLKKNVKEFVPFPGQVSSPRRAIIEEALSENRVNTEILWSALKAISCWTDAGAQRFVPLLEESFPGVEVQSKGLLATEGMVTIPLQRAKGCVLAVSSSFVEFLSENGDVLLCDQLTLGSSYRILLTTFGGLYRYDIGDSVRITGFYETSPVLEFIGRGNLVSDLCGEKLDEKFASACLTPVPGFAMLAPVEADYRGYVLLVDREIIPESHLASTVETVEQNLMRNPQYEHARRLGQLEPLSGMALSNPLQQYERLCQESGLRLGTLKPLSLTTRRTWAKQLLS